MRRRWLAHRLLRRLLLMLHLRRLLSHGLRGCLRHRKLRRPLLLGQRLRRLVHRLLRLPNRRLLEAYRLLLLTHLLLDRRLWRRGLAAQRLLLLEQVQASLAQCQLLLLQGLLLLLELLLISLLVLLKLLWFAC